MARVLSGSRNRPRLSQDVCADCGAADPGWASINRGILICDECCSVHRSLGRHVSHVKSLKKGTWHPSQLVMVHSLNNSGANHIWEHTLLDPSNAKTIRRKPQAKDPVHPNKADFIRAKHQMMSFVYRPSKEDITSIDGDVSCQLHASVRTRNLETSLRLLSQGADPNYYHNEKGNSPIHVAARAGQESQLELLVLYGADPGACDKDGKTPIDYARETGFHDIADRLFELQYELTDSLAFYLCGRKPDHLNGQHWIIPEMADSVESSDFAKEAKGKLVALPNHSFEELACDIYDEVERRETDSIWLSMQNQSALLSDRCSVPFLPVNPEFSSTRNQGRQKLARLNAREFATLIIDVLIEARRRMGRQITLTSMIGMEKDNTDMTVTPINISTLQLTDKHGSNFGDKGNKPYSRQTCPTINPRHGNSSISTTFGGAQSQPSLTNTQTHTLTNSARMKDNNNRPYDEEPLYDSVASEDDYSSWDRRRKIQSQQEILQRQSKPTHLDSDYLEVPDSPHDVSQLESNVAAAVSIDEYLDMKRHLEFSETRIKELQDNNIVMSAKLDELSTMVYTLKEENDSLRCQSPSFYGNQSPLKKPHFHHGNVTDSPRKYLPFYDSPIHSLQNGDYVSQPYGSLDNASVISNESSGEKLPQPINLPTQEEVVCKTEVITKRIQELLLAAQDSNHESFIPCSEHINHAVQEMAELFPKIGCPPDVVSAVQQLVTSAHRLHSECRNHLNSQLHLLDPGRVTQQVIQCAYDIAKAAKVLVTHFQ